MQFTEAQKAQFRQDYAHRRRNQLMVSLPLIALVFVVTMADDRKASTILGISAQIAGPIFLAIVGAALLFSFRNWRCPACNGYLGRVFNPRHCHACGVELHG